MDKDLIRHGFNLLIKNKKRLNPEVAEFLSEANISSFEEFCDKMKEEGIDLQKIPLNDNLLKEKLKDKLGELMAGNSEGIDVPLGNNGAKITIPLNSSDIDGMSLEGFYNHINNVK